MKNAVIKEIAMSFSQPQETDGFADNGEGEKETADCGAAGFQALLVNAKSSAGRRSACQFLVSFALSTDNGRIVARD